jgi:hypothetical protein
MQSPAVEMGAGDAPENYDELDQSFAQESDFNSAYDAATYEPLEALSKVELIEKIRGRDESIDALHDEASKLQSENIDLLKRVEDMEAELAELRGNEPKRDGSATSVQEIEEAEAHAYEDDDF